MFWLFPGIKLSVDLNGRIKSFISCLCLFKSGTVSKSARLKPKNQTNELNGYKVFAFHVLLSLFAVFITFCS